MATVEVAAGQIDYTDSGGNGPVLVFTHGLPMTHTQWRKVLPALPDYRCICPTLPLGAHRVAVRTGTDLSHVGQAHILADLLDALDLDDVTLVMNDWGGPQFLISEDRTTRVSRMVLISCEAFDNFPPRPVRPLIRLLQLPGGGSLLMRLLATRFVRHNRRTFGGLTSVGVPDAILDDWFAPATRDRRVRRDLVAFATSTPPRRELLERAARLTDFARPTLIVWGAQDQMMPLHHAERLAELLPDSRLELIPGARTLVPEDQPEALVAVLRRFLAETEPARKETK